MDDLKQLARITVRLFYTERQIVLIDLLTQQPSVPEQFLAFQMKLNPHEVRKSIGRLLMDKFVKSTSVKDPRSSATKTFYKTTYYLDYKSMYDSVKYKIWKIQQIFQAKSKTERLDRKYVCKKCGMKYDQVEATQFLYGAEMIFKCPMHRPTEVFALELEEEKESESAVKLMKFNEIVGPILRLLRAIEASKERVKEFKGVSKELQKEQMEFIDTLMSNKDSGKGIIQKTQQEQLDAQGEDQVEVEILTDQKSKDLDETEREKERKRTQNILPQWHSVSTVLKPSDSSAGVIGNAAAAEEDGGGAVTPTASGLDLQTENSDMMTMYRNYFDNLKKQNSNPLSHLSTDITTGEKRKATDEAEEDLSGETKKQKTTETEEAQEESEDEFEEI
jgi:transcription initiation factor IIE alpha subunit